MSILRRAYARGTIDLDELEPRVGAALQARNVGELAGSVRGIPGGAAEIAMESYIVPAVRAGTLGVRIWAASLVIRIAVAGWVLASLLLLTVFGIWALAAGPPLRGGIALLLVWLAVSAGVVVARRGARRLSRL